MNDSKCQIEAELKAMYLRREEIAPDHDPELERSIKVAHSNLEMLGRMDSSKLFDDQPYIVPAQNEQRRGPYSI